MNVPRGSLGLGVSLKGSHRLQWHISHIVSSSLGQNFFLLLLALLGLSSYSKSQ